MLVGIIYSTEKNVIEKLSHGLKKGIEEQGTYFCRIVVEPAFKFNKLKEVMVLKDY